MYYNVNGEELYSGSFPTLYGQEFGFTLNGDQTLLVDYLVVSYLD